MRMSSGPSRRKLKPRARCVELRRGHAEVEEDSVSAARLEVLRELREAGAHEAGARICIKEDGRGRRSLRIAINGNQLPLSPSRPRISPA